MPRIFKIICDNCRFTLPSGTGRSLFRRDDQGETKIISHPMDIKIIDDLMEGSPRISIRRLGLITHCVCLDCLKSFDLDLGLREIVFLRPFLILGCLLGRRNLWGHDRKKCPACSSKKIAPVWKLLENQCPKCRHGSICRIDTGFVS
jgi:hypothetical protein